MNAIRVDCVMQTRTHALPRTRNFSRPEFTVPALSSELQPRRVRPDFWPKGQ
jgi:hypothetical protein